MLEKAAVFKRFEYSQLGKELKAQTSFVEKHYQGKNKFIKTDEKEEPITIRKEKPEVISESKLIYESKVGFSYYKDVRSFSDISFISKYYKLLSFLSSIK